MSSPPILVIASCVAPIGDPLTGGVTRFLESTSTALAASGYHVDVLAPADSIAVKDSNVYSVTGTLQPTASSVSQGLSWPVLPNSILANMMQKAFELQDTYHCILNLNHDWLPFYLTPFFRCPLCHVPNLSWSSRATDEIIATVARRFVRQVAFLSRYQARCFEVRDPYIIPFALDRDKYELGSGNGGYLSWAGRIVPEKGLKRAAELARAARKVLRVAGPIVDQTYWDAVQRQYKDVIVYDGFLERPSLQAMLGGAEAFLQTQEWHEALGIVTIESIMCGAPVVAVDRGANAEIVIPGVTGYLIDATHSLAEGVEAIVATSHLSRIACREFAVQKYSLEALSLGYRNWFDKLG